MNVLKNKPDPTTSAQYSNNWKGGMAKFKKYGRAAYSEMGKKGMKSRWGKKNAVIDKRRIKVIV